MPLPVVRPLVFRPQTATTVDDCNIQYSIWRFTRTKAIVWAACRNGAQANTHRVPILLDIEIGADLIDRYMAWSIFRAGKTEVPLLRPRESSFPRNVTDNMIEWGGIESRHESLIASGVPIVLS